AAERVADAVARVSALSAALQQAPSAAAATFAADPVRIASAFELRAGVELPVESRLVALETTANMAVGDDVPWGLASAGLTPERLYEGDALPTSEVPYLIVGKDNHRHTWTRELIDRARAAQPATVVIDMGWPGTDRAYADIATFGASASV